MMDAGPTLTPLRLLLVEDSEHDAQYLLRVLRSDGFDPVCERVETAEALELALRRGPWDAVVTDYLLPGLVGTVALRLAKEHDRAIPVIVMSLLTGC